MADPGSSPGDAPQPSGAGPDAGRRDHRIDGLGGERLPGEPLGAALLHGAPLREAETVNGGAWAYGRAGFALVSLFVAYHVLALLLHVTPHGGLAKRAKETIGYGIKTGAYIRATSNIQSWSMFAPNPHRSNVFVRVLAEDQAGTIWDLGHDMHGRRRYPYVFYDRMAKINRRLADRGDYLEPYAAWACREWERTRGGEPARRVHLVKISSRVPPPTDVVPAPETIRPSWTTIGHDPLRLELKREPLKVFECAMLREGQLSPERRAQLGLPRAPEGHYRPVRERASDRAALPRSNGSEQEGEHEGRLEKGGDGE